MSLSPYTSELGVSRAKHLLRRACFHYNKTLLYQISSLNVDAEQLIFVTENGFGNKVSINSYSSQNRGGQGVISIKTSDRNGEVVGAVNVENNDFIILITNKGKTIKISASDMKTINRNTQGVRLQDMSDDEKISAISSERTED